MKKMQEQNSLQECGSYSQVLNYVKKIPCSLKRNVLE